MKRGKTPMDPQNPTRLMKEFADCLLARERLLNALGSRAADLRPALRDVYVSFQTLFHHLAPGTPPEILDGLTQTMALNLCRRAVESAESEASAGRDGSARVIELLAQKTPLQETHP
ncbi:MAG: hypothetical protein NTW86_31855 [Candidatus Sumerlaeota bacterium]|nr:hypothetical protein [Candidatus Sumerlaeota bacterium]